MPKLTEQQKVDRLIWVSDDLLRSVKNLRSALVFGAVSILGFTRFDGVKPWLIRYVTAFFLLVVGFVCAYCWYRLEHRISVAGITIKQLREDQVTADDCNIDVFEADGLPHKD